ncbi:T9SS type A sorting domain-containing protein [Polaribacter sp. IC073]|uniref:T9SS type A sorting domain-containing protein n=1 Tax=Polaribacter sp. IC073 TaxID=2508540 RepID=UPI0011BD88E5|nr:T9SS type A sorting domain-containing protein [Polaribacter sp. IC073]TXD47227.1 T9SS type A sorting domain-containing protein [Polaribacter sp. IC073]
MKKITLLIILLVTSLGYAQQQEYLLDFEDGTPSGTASNWYTFDNEPAAAEVVDNPDLDGVNNTASKVLKVVVGPGNAFYAGVNNKWQDSKFGTWKLDMSVASNLTLSIDVNKNYVGTVGIKMGTNTSGTSFQITDQNVGNTVVDEWQTLTWDLSGINPNGDLTNINQMVVFVDWTQGQADRAANSTIFIDNIKFNAEMLTAPVTAPTSPVVAAPTPVQAAGNVISLYSDAYTDVAVNNFISFSNGATLEDVMIEGNATKKYSNLDYVGIETLGANLIDASAMTTLHMDIWTPDANNFKVKVVDFGADKGYQGGDDSEHEIVYASTETGQWISYDIPLTNFAGLTAKTNLAQYILSKNPGGTIYIDNIYFHNDAVVLTAPAASATTPTVAVANVYSLFSDTYTNNAPSSYTQAWGEGTVADFTVESDNMKKYSALNFQAITLSSTVDLANYTHLHIDVWTPEANAFGIKFQDFGADNMDEYPNADDSEMEVQSSTSQTAGAWVSHDFAIADFTGLTGKANLGQIQLLLGSATGGTQGTAFVDNIYLYTAATAGVDNNTLASVSLYPNPSTNFLNISSDKRIEKASIYNILGKLVQTISVDDTSKIINVSNLSAGIYLIKYTVEDAVGTAKFIKQ